VERDEDLWALVDRIYASAVDPPRWREFVEGISTLLGDAAVGFALQSPGFDGPPYVFGRHLRPELGSVFVRHFARGLPWGAFTHPRYLGRFGRSSEGFPDERLPGTDFYRSWMEPQGLAPEGPVVHVMAVREGRPLAGLALYRRAGGRPLTDDDLARANRLVPHLARSFEIHGALGHAQAERDGLAESVDRLPIGILLLDAARRPVFANQSAEALLEEGDGLGVEAGGLRIDDAATDARLRRLVDDAAKNAFGETTLAGTMLLSVPRPSGRRDYNALVTPLLASTRRRGPGDAVASLWISDPDAVQITTSQILQRLYQLTPAEAELLRYLANGRSLEEAAAARGITVNTARTQLKQVFTKTETRRQGELLRLVLTGIAAIREE